MAAERIRRRTAKNRELYKRLRLYEALTIGFSCVLAAFFLFLFITPPVRMVDNAMAPAICENDVVLTFGLSKLFSKPVRGDIVAIANRTEGADAGFRIVRIIAVGGETVEIKDGKIYINGGLLREEGYTAAGTEMLPDMEMTEIPKDGYFVLCDDRSGLGGISAANTVVERRRIKGEVFMLLYPFGKMGFFGSEN